MLPKLVTKNQPPELSFKVGRSIDAIPDGEYCAVVLNIEQSTFIGKRPILRFTFELRGGPHSGCQALGFVNANYESFSSHTKLYQWYLAANGGKAPEAADLNCSVFLDKVLKVKVQTKKSRKTGLQFPNVVEILGVELEL